MQELASSEVCFLSRLQQAPSTQAPGARSVQRSIKTPAGGGAWTRVAMGDHLLRLIPWPSLLSRTYDSQFLKTSTKLQLTLRIPQTCILSCQAYTAHQLSRKEVRSTYDDCDLQCPRHYPGTPALPGTPGTLQSLWSMRPDHIVNRRHVHDCKGTHVLSSTSVTMRSVLVAVCTVHGIRAGPSQEQLPPTFCVSLMTQHSRKPQPKIRTSLRNRTPEGDIYPPGY